MTFASASARMRPMETTELEAAAPLYLYEIAYLLSPLVMAENAVAEVDKVIKAPIDSLGGNLTSQLAPILRPLAYPVAKTVSGKRQAYRDAYFGAARFELGSQPVLEFKNLLDKNEQLLRFMIMRLPKSADRAINPNYRKILATHRDPLVTETLKEEEAVVAPELKGEVNKEELDKEIEGLLEEKAVI